jgi:PAS domain S-box-containing protein
VEDDAVRGTVGTVREITDLEPGGREQRRRLERYERIVENLPVGVYRNTPGSDGEFVAVNSTLAEIFGADSEEELLEYDARDLYPDPDQRAEFSQRLEREGRVEDFELRQETLNGDTIWIAVTAIRTEEGGEVFFDGIVQDITERKERERELRQKERRFEAVFEDPNILVGLLDPDGTVLDINQTAMEYIDAELDDVTGEPFWETPWWGEEDGVTQDIERWVERAANGEYVDFEADLTQPGGQQYSLEGVFRPVTNDDGEVVSLIVSDRDVTKRKERERELKRYERILETIEDGVYVLDGDSRFLLANEAFASMLGVDRDSLSGKHVSFAFGEKAASTGDELQREMIEDEIDIAELEETLVTADGEVPVTTRFTLFETDGEFGRVGVVRDVTERKERERALEESERRYRTLVENFPNGAVGLVDEDLRYTVAGGEMFMAADITSDELVGQTVRERYPEALADAFEANLRAAFEGETNTFEIGFHDRHWQAHTLPVRDEEDDIFAAMVMVQDITAQIEREQELQASKNQLQASKNQLQASKNQLQALIELLPVAVFVAEDDGQIVEWNEAAEEIWGGQIAESESIAEYAEYDGWWADTGEPVEPEEWPLARALRGEEVTDPDVVEIEGFDGERRTVLNHGMPVRDADGEVSRAVVTLIDITERKEYQRKLEESNERLKQFAYAASHDLQEPLRMVSSYLRLIEERYADELDEDGREFIDFAVDGADRMRDMIDGLLEYSRVDTRGDPFETVDLDDVLADVREDLQMTIEESDAEITADSLPRVVGDPGQLRQVFQNLLDNAIEYSGDEPPEVRVSAGTDTNAAPEAAQNAEKQVISVSDRGVGIDPADAERVFEVFQRLHAPDEHPGTGIGLALCERIIERHGGDIWVESEPGEGATFSFTLPAAGDDGD